MEEPMDDTILPVVQAKPKTELVVQSLSAIPPKPKPHWTDPKLIMQLPPSRRPKGFVPPEPKWPTRVKLKPRAVDLPALGLGKYQKP